MNTMISNGPTPEYVAGLLARITELEQELNGKLTVLAMAAESLQSYKAEVRDWQNKHENLVESVTALALEHLENEGTHFYDEIVDLFNIELTKVITVQMTVSIEVQATVPAGMDDDEAAEELTNATLDYSFFGNGDFIIEDFTFGEMEQE